MSTRLLSASTVFWFCTVAGGQLLFIYYLVAFYGVSTLSLQPEMWNRLEYIGGQTPYEPGDDVGNTTYLLHVLAATVIAGGGLLQLISRLRSRFPGFHKWNGRIFVATCIGLTLSGFVLVWVLDRSPGETGGIATSLNGVLILCFAFLTVRSILSGRVTQHSKWALRLFLVANAQWFLRIGLFAYFFSCRVLEIDPARQFSLYWDFGCFLMPLLFAEFYFATKQADSRATDILFSTCLITLTLIMLCGIGAFTFVTNKLITGDIG